MTYVNIYHIANEADWSRRSDSYAPEGWRSEGFVHCSTREQVVRTANRFFGGRADLVLLHIDPTQLAALVVWEDGEGSGEDFPHVYGAIEISSVVAAEPFGCGPDGSFDWWEAPN
jgi:uncharacterized protein (DUF952 family)